MERMLRNYPELTYAGIALAVLAISLGAFGLTIDDKTKTPATWKWFKEQPVRVWIFRLGALALLAGLLIVLLTAALAPGTSAQPSIAVNLKTDPRLELNVQVKANAIESKEKMSVRVLGFDEVRKLNGDFQRDQFGNRTYHQPDTLYLASLGPAANGDVDHSFVVPLAEGNWTDVVVNASVGDEIACTQQSDVFVRTDRQAPRQIRYRRIEPGCSWVRLPRRNVRPLPQLSTSWDKASGTMLILTVASDQMLTTELVALAVTQGRASPRELYKTMLSPDGKGSFSGTVKIPITQRGAICAAARIVSTRPRGSEDIPATDPEVGCPPTADRFTTWARIYPPT